MKTAIIYKSFLGTTQKYAQWLREELGADIFEFGKIKKEKLEAYEIVVVSSGTYASWMPLVGYVKKIWKYIKDKKVVIIAVGIAPPKAGWSIKSYKKIPKNIREKVKYFKLPGKSTGKLAGKVEKENVNPVIEYIKSL
jgi:menaquinone-dependent protoporphyrinogen IX oxidase